MSSHSTVSVPPPHTHTKMAAVLFMLAVVAVATVPTRACFESDVRSPVVVVDNSLAISAAEAALVADVWDRHQRDARTRRKRRSAATTIPTVTFDVGTGTGRETFVVQRVVDVPGTRSRVLLGESRGRATAYLVVHAPGSDAAHVAVRSADGRVSKVHTFGGVVRGVPSTGRLDLPDEAEPDSTGAGDSKVRRTVCPPESNTTTAAGEALIRVGVLYSPQVKALPFYGGSAEAVEMDIATAVAEANAVVFPLSGVNIVLELCMVKLVLPTLERSSPSRTLHALRDSADVAALKAQNKCDAVVLMSSLAGLGNRVCGISHSPGSHSVVAADCFVDNLSFLHELGHNLGACHGPPALVCSSGANGYADAARDFRTIMAYRAACGGLANCTRIPRFSNSARAYNWTGAPIGVAGRNDAARLLNANSGAMAQNAC